MTGGFRAGFVNGTECDAVDLPWSGAPLPPWIHGAVLVRNGPGLFHLAEQSVNHWFDGLALLTRYEFTGAGVQYRAAFLASRDHDRTTAAGRVQFTEFGTAPRRPWRERLRLLLHPGDLFGDNASVHVIPVNGEWWALWDVPHSMRLEDATLATRGRAVERTDRRVLLRTPHPVREGDTWVNVGVGLTNRGPGYTVFAVEEPTMRPQPIASVASWTPAYLHSFALSRDHVVITEHSFGPTPGGGLALLFGSRPLAASCRWRRRHHTRMLVVDRRVGALVRSVRLDPVEVLHHVNAFEDDSGVLHVDACAFTDRGVLDRLFFSRLDAPGGGTLARSRLVRYHLDLVRGSATTTELTDVPVELPTYDPRRTGLSYRYVYGVSMHRGDDFNDQLVKVDLDTGQATPFHLDGTYPGEPLFVPRPGGTAEDDGVVLTVLLDSTEPCSYLVALDAASFTEIGRARLPHVVPHGLHGSIRMPTGAAR